MKELLPIALCLVAIAPRLAWAHDGGSITGRVTEEGTGEPLPEVTVTVSGPALQGELTESTDQNGSYQIVELPVGGDYTLRFYYVDTVIERPNVVISAGRLLNVSVAIATRKAQTQTIQITERAPSIDVGAPQVVTTFSRELADQSPLRGRTFQSVLRLAPGAATDQVGTSFNGSTGAENNYLIGGFNVSGVSFGLLGAPLSLEFVEETEVILGGSSAEYGRSTGGVVDVVTRSGSNQLRGELFMGFTPIQLPAEIVARSGEAIATRPNAASYRDLDVGLTLGGPILKDRIWFFAGFHPQFSEGRTERFLRRRLASDAPAAPDLARSPAYAGDQTGDGVFVTEAIDGSSREFFSQSWLFNTIGKLDFRIDDDNRASLEYLGHSSTFDGVAANPHEASGLSGNDFNGNPSTYRYGETIPGHDLIGRFSTKLLERKLILHLAAGFHLQAFTVTPENLAAHIADSNQRSLASFEDVDACHTQTLPNGQSFDPCPVSGYGYGGFGFYRDSSESRFATSVAAKYLTELAGTHQLEVGADFELESYRDRRGYTGKQLYRIGSGDGGFRQSFSAVGADGSVAQLDGFEAQSKSFGEMVFISEAYRPDFALGLSVNLGLRWDLQQLQGDDGEIAASLNDNLSPRLGFVYDFSKKGLSKFYASYGRLYEAIPLDLADRAFSRESLTRQFSGPCARDDRGRIDAARCPFAPLRNDSADTIVSRGEKTLVSPQLGGQYADEFLAGVEYDLGADFVFGAAFLHRSLGRVIEDISLDGARTFFIANPGEPADPGVVRDLVERIGSLDARIAQAAPAEESALAGERDRNAQELAFLRGAAELPRPERHYNAVVLTARKRFSDNFQLLASYTWSRTVGNYPGLYDDAVEQLDPNVSGQYDLASLLLNRDGPLPNDRPHNFSLLASYFIPTGGEQDGVSLGIVFNAQSGVPIEVLGADPIYDRRYTFILPRGSGGRTPFITALDFKLGYRFDAVELGWEVFNVFNQRTAIAVDQEYTFDKVLPIVNGTRDDLEVLKTVTGATPRRNPNYGQPTAYQLPLSMRFSARVIF